MSTWTDERIGELKRMWIEGMSASQIAQALGAGISRNAVIGKIHRLGLSGRAPVHRAAPRRLQPSQRRAPRRLHALPRLREAEPDPIELLDIDPTLHPNVLTLNERTCKWPIGHPGEEGFHFCGRRVSPGLPYCAEHGRVAYQPLLPRRDRSRRA